MPRHLLRLRFLSLFLVAFFVVPVLSAQTTLPSRPTRSGSVSVPPPPPAPPSDWMTGGPGGMRGPGRMTGPGGWYPWMMAGGPCGPMRRSGQTPVSPYDAAADEAARVPVNKPSPSPTPGATLTRPNVGERQWSTDPSSPYFAAQEQAASHPSVVRSAGAGTGYDADAFASQPSDPCSAWAPWMMFDPYGYGAWLDYSRQPGTTMTGPGARGGGVSGRPSPTKGRGQGGRPRRW